MIRKIGEYSCKRHHLENYIFSFNDATLNALLKSYKIKDIINAKYYFKYNFRREISNLKENVNAAIKEMYAELLW